jgi:sugar lactone lactonase YvrE
MKKLRIFLYSMIYVGVFTLPPMVFSNNQSSVTFNSTSNSTTTSPSFVKQWVADGCGIAIDSVGNVYVANSNGQVQKFTKDGVLIPSWTLVHYPKTTSQIFPNAVAVDSVGNVYVVERQSMFIDKFSKSGIFLCRWGGCGTGNGKFMEASGIAIDSIGNVYVTDKQSNFVQKFTDTGTFVSKWGGFGIVALNDAGSGKGKFQYPDGVAVDSDGNIYVADELNGLIQKFDSKGDFLMNWKASEIWDGTNPPMDSESGYTKGDVLGPSGVAVDSSNNVYVCISEEYVGNKRIEKFTSDGSLITQWGGTGNGNGKFSSLKGIAVDSTGNIYVADRGNKLIQKFQ